jgi:hypothetical protein
MPCIRAKRARHASMTSLGAGTVEGELVVVERALVDHRQGRGAHRRREPAAALEVVAAALARPRVESADVGGERAHPGLVPEQVIYLDEREPAVVDDAPPPPRDDRVDVGEVRGDEARPDAVDAAERRRLERADVLLLEAQPGCRWRARARRVSSRSTPMTSTPACASVAVTAPTPQPRSRTRWPRASGTRASAVSQRRQRSCCAYSSGSVISREPQAAPADERPAGDHWITSSARAYSDGGIVRPSALAVSRLMTSPNFVGCSNGKSPAS